MTSTSGTPACQYCGMLHFGGVLCPRIKAIEYHPNGTIKRVELAPTFLDVQGVDTCKVTLEQP